MRSAMASASSRSRGVSANVPSLVAIVIGSTFVVAAVMMIASRARSASVRSSA